MIACEIGVVLHLGSRPKLLEPKRIQRVRKMSLSGRERKRMRKEVK